MNSFLPVMKFVYYLSSVNCRNCMLSGLRNNASTTSNNSCLVGSSLRIFMPCLARNFTLYASLCNDSAEDFREGYKMNKGKNQTKSPMVSVIDENNVERVMSLNDAQKLAKRNKLDLVKSETPKGNKIKYRLEKPPEIHEANKIKEKNIKKVVLTEDIQNHDVEIKIKQVLRFLEKGLDVVCIIGTVKKEKQDRILGLLDNSQLKDYITGTKGTKRGINLTYAANMVKKTDEQGEGKNIECDKSSK